MIYKGRKIKIAVLLIIVVALMFSTIWIMRTRATEDSENTFQGSYTIEYLIKHYNLVTLNDVEAAEHIVGPILVGGDIKSALCHSQITNNISSYIKGKITNGGNVQPPEGQSTPTLYLGSSNAVETFDDSTTNVNGAWYTNSPVVVTDNYIDFNSLYGSVRSQAKGLAEGTIVEPDESGIINIQIGDTVTIKSLENVSEINITGNMNSIEVTLINIEKSGAINFPKVTMNGEQVKTSGSSSAGVAIVWNLPNANKVQLTNAPFIGHLIAPDADLTVYDTNYAGCFIVKSLSGHIEGHFYPYNNGSLPTGQIPEPDEDEKDENNTVDPGDRNETTDNNTTDPGDKNETTGNNTIDPDDRNETTDNNTTDPGDKNETTGNNTIDSDDRNETTDNNTIDADDKEPEEEPEEDPVDREPQNDTEDPVDRNTMKGNKTNKVDNTISKTKLPQTGKGLDKEIVLVAILMVLVAVFGIKYVVHSNKFDANK